MKKFVTPILLIVGFVLAYNLGHSFGFTLGYASAELKHAEETSFVDSHQTTDLVMHCMDFRFQGMEHRFTCNTCGKKADKLSWPGSVKIINSEDRKLQEEALSAIKTAVDNHGAEKIHLINHIDCSKYGGSSQHADLTAERQFHIKELLNASRIIHERFPALDIHVYIASRDGIEEIDAEQENT